MLSGPPTQSGRPGRALAGAYAVFAAAAAGRSAVELALHASRAPLAYGLSAAAALVYVGGLIAMIGADRHRRARRWASWLCRIELAGVLIVGAASLRFPAALGSSTVWSHFGSGYGFVPAVLPIFALAWLRTTDRAKLTTAGLRQAGP